MINPTFAQREKSDLDFVVACSRDALVMVEGGSDQISEVATDALFFAHQAVQPVLDLIESCAPRSVVRNGCLRHRPGRGAVQARRRARRRSHARRGHGSRKHARHDAESKVGKGSSLSCVLRRAPTLRRPTPAAKRKSTKPSPACTKTVREMVLSEQVRIDGRKTTDIRPISCEVGVLPRVHGSALFTRGETQAWSSPPWVRRPTSSASIRCWVTSPSASCCTLQLPAVFDGRSEDAARSVASRSRPRQPRRARSPAHHAQRAGVSLRCARRLGDAGVER